MSTSDFIDDGGTAFPVKEEMQSGQFRMHYGMSLRDYFAGQALQGVLASFPDDVEEAQFSLSVIAKQCSLAAYAYADAMLNQREKTGGES